MSLARQPLSASSWSLSRVGARLKPWPLGFWAASSALGLALAQAMPAKAVVLADNLTQADGTGIIVGDGTVGNFWEAMKFNTTTASIIRSVTGSLNQGTGTTGSATFEIYSDNAGVPGSFIATVGSVAMSNLTPTYTNYTASGLSISLNQNSSYFLVAKAVASNGNFGWARTASTSGFGTLTTPVRVRSGSAGATWETGFSTYTVLRIEADSITVPGPLPVLGGAAAFAWSRRLRRRIGATTSAARQTPGSSS